MPFGQQRAIAQLFAAMDAEAPLVTPDDGWRGVECGSVRRAIWMMRALVVHNVLSRREGTVLFVPVNQTIDPAGEGVARVLAVVQRLAAARDIL